MAELAEQGMEFYNNMPTNIEEMTVAINELLIVQRRQINLNQMRRYKELFVHYQSRWFGNQDLIRLFRQSWDLFAVGFPDVDVLQIYGLQLVA